MTKLAFTHQSTLEEREKISQALHIPKFIQHIQPLLSSSLRQGGRKLNEGDKEKPESEPLFTTPTSPRRIPPQLMPIQIETSKDKKAMFYFQLSPR